MLNNRRNVKNILLSHVERECLESTADCSEALDCLSKSLNTLFSTVMPAFQIQAEQFNVLVSALECAQAVRKCLNRDVTVVIPANKNKQLD